MSVSIPHRFDWTEISGEGYTTGGMFPFLIDSIERNIVSNLHAWANLFPFLIDSIELYQSSPFDKRGSSFHSS